MRDLRSIVSLLSLTLGSILVVTLHFPGVYKVFAEFSPVRCFGIYMLFLGFVAYGPSPSRAPKTWLDTEIRLPFRLPQEPLFFWLARKWRDRRPAKGS